MTSSLKTDHFVGQNSYLGNHKNRGLGQNYKFLFAQQISYKLPKCKSIFY